MRWLFTLIGITCGASCGSAACGLVGWLSIRLLAGPHALSNPDLPGGMAWLSVIIVSAVGFFVGGSYGVRLGTKLFLQWSSELSNSTDEERQ